MIPKTKAARTLIHKGLTALNRATIRGIRIDVPYCKKVNKKLEKRLKALEKKIKESKFGRQWKHVYSNMNIRSDLQLGYILFDRLKMPIIKYTEKGNPSVNAETLNILSKEIPDLKILSDYKTIYSANNFIKNFLKEQVDGFIHPGFPLNKVLSFRGSSENPNFQNNPKRNKLQKNIVRKAIIPRKGRQLIEADYGGIEVMTACCVTGDEKLTYDAIHGDMHRDTAIEVYKLDKFEKKGFEKDLRFAGKNGFNFPQFYGDYWGNCVPSLLKLSDMPLKGKFKPNQGGKLMTGIHLGQHLISKDIKNVSSFEKHVESIEQSFWNERYKVYNKWRKDRLKEFKRKGYLTMVTGFVCKGLMSKNEITNYPMQGPAFHTLLNSYIETDKRQIKEKWKSFPIGEIHDAIVIDVYPNEKDYILDTLREIMINWTPKQKQFNWLTVPLEVEADVYEVDAPWSSESKTIVL